MIYPLWQVHEPLRLLEESFHNTYLFDKINILKFNLMHASHCFQQIFTVFVFVKTRLSGVENQNSQRKLIFCI